MEYHITFTCDHADNLVEFDGYLEDDSEFKFGIKPFFIGDFASLTEAIEFTKNLAKNLNELEKARTGITISYARIECEVNQIFMCSKDGELEIDYVYFGLYNRIFERDCELEVAFQREHGSHKPYCRKLLSKLEKGSVYRNEVARAILNKRKEERKYESNNR